MKTEKSFKPAINVTIDYHLIVSIDCYKSDYPRTIAQVKPDFLKKRNFFVTETEVEDPEYYSQHRKYCGIISAEKLEEIVQNEIYPEDVCQTMGALTIEFGMLPAISWSVFEHGYDINVYVSPIFRDNGQDIQVNLDKLNDKQKEVVYKRIDTIVSNAMDRLENNTDEYEDDFGFLKSATIDFAQLEFQL
jgi:hypothetical protein